MKKRAIRRTHRNFVDPSDHVHAAPVCRSCGHIDSYKGVVVVDYDDMERARRTGYIDCEVYDTQGYVCQDCGHETDAEPNTMGDVAAAFGQLVEWLREQFEYDRRSFAVFAKDANLAEAEPVKLCVSAVSACTLIETFKLVGVEDAHVIAWREVYDGEEPGIWELH